VNPFRHRSGTGRRALAVQILLQQQYANRIGFQIFTADVQFLQQIFSQLGE